MRHKFLPKQKEFFEVPDDGMEIDVSLYQGGYGSVKAYSGAFKGIVLSNKYLFS